MTHMPVLPRAGEWTVEDLDRLADDGLRHELVDGVVLVSPSPSLIHQRAVGRLFRLLAEHEPDGFEAVVAPFDFRPTARRSLRPDVQVLRRREPTTAPVLVVEVLSPGTRSVDLLLKRGIYEESGIAGYWLVDPAVPSLTVLARGADGHYAQVAHVEGSERLDVDAPFPVSVVPAELVSD